MVSRFFSPIRPCSVFVLLVLLLSSLSCGHKQQLVSIDVQPATETFGATNIPVSEDAGLNVQLRALGNYIHPPVTKDITAEVTWASNTPGIATVDPSGLLTATGQDCGNALISATLVTNHSNGNISSTGALVTGNMTANVVCFSSAAQQATVSVNFVGGGAGVITSSPRGLSCAGNCSASLAGGPITLRATPNGSTFGGWAGCDSVSEAGRACTVNDSGSQRAVTVTFN